MPSVLALNAGSSSIKFALYDRGEPPKLKLAGKVDRIGLPGTNLSFHEVGGARQVNLEPAGCDYSSATSFLIEWLENQEFFTTVGAVGHRLVHGMAHVQPTAVTQLLLDDLRRIIPCDPEHLPKEIELIEAFQQRHPKLRQVVCFDTEFHSGLPQFASVLPIPRQYAAKGVRRYGFHGLSYASMLKELARRGDPAAVRGRVILAHLGNGASMAAVRDGQCIDTSMGFTPAGGLVMGTRSGDLDPGLAFYLGQTEQMSSQQFNDMVNHQSGLLGISETSSDMRDLIARATHDIRAAEAIAVFCYQAKKWLGAFAAALGGLDTLVFSGGIGENNPSIRARICEGLGFLSIEIAEASNRDNTAVISTEASRVAVHVIRADEEMMIAQAVYKTLCNQKQP